MSAKPGTAVELAGVVNARDLGGWATAAGRVRRGQLYRSGALHGATPADVARLRDDLGVRWIVDLRGAREIELDGLGALAAPPVQHLSLSLLEGASDPARAATLLERYVEILERAGGPLAHLLETLATTADPVLVHCFAGKDRTGVVAAVVLGVLGVADADIVADYARTREQLPAIRASLEASRAFAEVVDRFPPETLHADPETMEQFLVEVRGRFGDMRGYVRGIGVTERTLSALAERLIESPAGA
ncbi:MAG: tyrosine-protein phosphatase [Myxococcota bacterium]